MIGILIVALGALFITVICAGKSSAQTEREKSSLLSMLNERTREIEELEKERKTVDAVLQEKGIMEIFYILHKAGHPYATKKELSRLWDVLPYYPPDWELRKHIVRARDGNRCKKCGRKLPFEYLDIKNCIKTDYGEVHHIIPLSQKGTNCIKNLELLCTYCHKKVHHELYNFIMSQIKTDDRFIKTHFLWEEYKCLLRGGGYDSEGDVVIDSYKSEEPDTDAYYNIPLWENWEELD